MAVHTSPRMFGLFPLIEPVCPVERIGITSQQVYPQAETFLIQSTSWRDSKAPPISGGVHIWIFSTFFRIVHRARYLSTNNRGLSTDWLSRQTGWGNTRTAPVAGGLDR